MSDEETKIIENYETSTAIHDSNVCAELISDDTAEQTTELPADSGYFGEAVSQKVREKGVKPRIIQRRVKGQKKLTKWQEKRNENKQKNPHAAPNCKTSMPIQSEATLCMGIDMGHFNFLNRAVGKSYNTVASGRSSVLGGRDGEKLRCLSFLLSHPLLNQVPVFVLTHSCGSAGTSHQTDGKNGRDTRNNLISCDTP